MSVKSGWCYQKNQVLRSKQFALFRTARVQAGACDQYPNNKIRFTHTWNQHAPRKTMNQVNEIAVAPNLTASLLTYCCPVYGL